MHASGAVCQNWQTFFCGLPILTGACPGRGEDPSARPVAIEQTGDTSPCNLETLASLKGLRLPYCKGAVVSWRVC